MKNHVYIDMRFIKKCSAVLALIAAALILIMVNPESARAEEIDAEQFMEDIGARQVIYVDSDEEGLICITQSFVNMDSTLVLNFNPEQVDVHFLLMYLKMLVNSDGVIHTYAQMMYDGFECLYSDDALIVHFTWKLSKEQEQIFDLTVGMLAPYLEGATQYDTIKNVHDWICMTTSYDDATVYGLANRHTGYNALFENLAVCDGYAMLFQKFMDKLGIACYCVTGNAHAWNMVMYEGQWYNIDCTWDDQDYGIIYEYFMY